MDKKFWAAVFTLSGTVVGAGILGLPYIFSKSGFLIGLFWLIILSLIILFVNLWIGEVTLRTKGTHQLTGYAEKYLGKTGKRIMIFVLVFEVYSALIAYLIGEGQSLSVLFTGTAQYSLLFAFLFWISMTFLLTEGLRGLKKIETWGVMAIILIIVSTFIFYTPQINLTNFTLFNLKYFSLPIGVILFALLGFVCIPELKMIVENSEKKLKKAIILGSMIPVVLYVLFTFTFVGFLGDKVPQVATISLGKTMNILGIFTMLTSYFSLSFVLKDMLKFDLKFSNKKSFLVVSLTPLLLYLCLILFNAANFILVLGIGGVISGGVIGILAIAMNIKAKKKGNRKPEYSIPAGWKIGFIIALIFVLGIISEIKIALTNS